MKTSFYCVTASFGIILSLLLGSSARAQDFEPDLGQPREIIAGKSVAHTTIPSDAKELTVYPLPVERPLQPLTALSGQAMKPVSPMPLARAWWKYPVYAAVGLPRDLLDGLVGGINFIPFVNIPIVYGGYELIPTQLLVRDPRDWHRWPGRGMNDLRHGPIDGDSWGWFPSFNTWHFTYPSKRLAEQNEIYNQKVKAQLDTANARIEAGNAQLEARLRDARTRALDATKRGNGREAAYRMIAYRHSFPLDEGGFALFATAMALYIPDGPAWVAPVLWGELDSAQPRLLIEAEKLLATTAQTHPDIPTLGEALIYTRLILGRNQGAIDAAQALLKTKPGDPFRQRLLFETAMTARDRKTARATRTAMSPNSYDAPTRALMDIRLNLLAGDAVSSIEPLKQLYAQAPENAYNPYYLACAQILMAQKMENPAEAYKSAADLMTRARDGAPGPALRQRADQASTWLSSVVSGISKSPELFAQSENTATSNTAAGTAASPKANAAATSSTTVALPPPPQVSAPDKPAKAANRKRAKGYSRHLTGAK